MPLTQTSLATRIVNEMIAEKGQPENPVLLMEFAQAIAKAVIDEIQQNAQVTTTVVGASATGGPVTGTGTGTVL